MRFIMFLFSLLMGQSAREFCRNWNAGWDDHDGDEMVWIPDDGLMPVV